MVSRRHSHDARITEICDEARAFALPVLYDVENELRMLDWPARHYPDLPFVIPYLRSTGENWRAHAAFRERLERNSNFYADGMAIGAQMESE
jgi:hypothetical protein